ARVAARLDLNAGDRPSHRMSLAVSRNAVELELLETRPLAPGRPALVPSEMARALPALRTRLYQREMALLPDARVNPAVGAHEAPGCVGAAPERDEQGERGDDVGVGQPQANAGEHGESSDSGVGRLQR